MLRPLLRLARPLGCVRTARSTATVMRALYCFNFAASKLRCALAGGVARQALAAKRSRQQWQASLQAASRCGYRSVVPAHVSSTVRERASMRMSAHLTPALAFPCVDASSCCAGSPCAPARFSLRSTQLDHAGHRALGVCRTTPRKLRFNVLCMAELAGLCCSPGHWMAQPAAFPALCGALWACRALQACLPSTLGPSRTALQWR